MGIFSSIKEAIFGKDEDEAAAPAAVPVDKAKASIGAGKAGVAKQITEVDVEARLDAMAGADKLNWRDSIVDLMKLTGLDPSFDNRKELAHEMGDADYSGKAEENIALHKHVMNELARNGGRVPASLRD